MKILYSDIKLQFQLGKIANLYDFYVTCNEHTIHFKTDSESLHTYLAKTIIPVKK